MATVGLALVVSVSTAVTLTVWPATTPIWTVMGL